MNGDEPTQPPSSQGAAASSQGPGSASLEDVVCLQSANEELRRERETLIKRLQTVESGAREKIQLAESRLREALAQVDALKRATQTVRAKFENDAALAKKRAEALKQTAVAAEAMQEANADLTTALEAAQCRVADLETESLVHQAEIERLTNELTAATERLATLEAESQAQRDAAAVAATRQAEVIAELDATRGQHAHLTAELAGLRQREIEQSQALDALRADWSRDQRERDQQLDALRDELGRAQNQRAELIGQLEAARAAHAAEIDAWQQTAAAREAELVNARDELARRLEDEQSQTIEAREEVERVGLRLRELEAGQHAATARTEQALQDLSAAQEEWARERAVFEATAREREAERQRTHAELEARLAAESSSAAERVAQLERDLQLQRDEITRVRDEAEQRAQQHARDFNAASESARAIAAQLAAEREQWTHDLDAVRGELAAAQADLAAAQTERQTLAAQAAERESVVAELNERLAALTGALGERDARVTAAVEEAAQLHRQNGEQRGTVESLRIELATAREQIDAAHTRAQALDEQLAQRAAEQTNLAERLATSETELRARGDQLARLQSEQDQLQRDHAAAMRANAERAQAAEAEWQARRERFEQDLQAVRQESDDRRLSIEAVRTKVRVLESQLAERDTVRNALSERIVTLEDDLRHRDEQLKRLSVQVAGQNEESTAWVEAAAQREAELVAARNDVLEQLDDERKQLTAAQAEAVALRSRIESVEQELAEAQTRLADQLNSEQALRVDATARAEESAARVQTIEAELAATAQREAEWRAAHQTLAHDLDDVRAQLAAAQTAPASLNATVQALQEQLAAREAAIVEIRGQLDTASIVTRDKDEALFAAEQRCVELTQHLEAVQEQSVGALQAQEAMSARIDELHRERAELLQRVNQMTTVIAQLERQSEKLQRERPAGEETRKLKVELARLAAKLKEVEAQQGEAVQRHSAAVAGYMVELNQRSEALHARNQEMERLAEELTLTRQTCDDAMVQVEAARRERAELEAQLKELRVVTAEAARPPSAAPAPMPPRPAAKAPAPPPPPAPTVAVPAASKSGGPLTLIHLEDNKAYRESLRDVLARVPQSAYLNTLDAPAAAGSRLLAVNLLNRAHDPFAAIAAETSEQPEIFAYCADASYGFAFGLADFFSQPIDADALVTQLLERRGVVQRLLAVSDNIEMTAALREVLSRMRCSTSVAFDSRQAIDLLPMIKPDVVLVDFALPRGEGFRLVARLRSEPKTRDVPLAVLLPATVNLAEFRQQALRVAREISMEPAQLAQLLAERLGCSAGADKGGLLKTG